MKRNDGLGGRGGSYSSNRLELKSSRRARRLADDFIVYVGFGWLVGWRNELVYVLYFYAMRFRGLILVCVCICVCIADVECIVRLVFGCRRRRRRSRLL